MPRYQQLISCTFHIDNLAAVFKAKLVAPVIENDGNF